MTSVTTAREPGQCLITTITDLLGSGPHSLRIDHADPYVHIHEELLDAIRSGYSEPDVTLTDDVLTIHGINRTVIYRVGNKITNHYGGDVYEAEWPD